MAPKTLLLQCETHDVCCFQCFPPARVVIPRTINPLNKFISERLESQCGFGFFVWLKCLTNHKFSQLDWYLKFIKFCYLNMRQVQPELSAKFCLTLRLSSRYELFIYFCQQLSNHKISWDSFTLSISDVLMIDYNRKSVGWSSLWR